MTIQKNNVVAITGGCGRIGSALTKELLRKGYKVLIGDVDKKDNYQSCSLPTLTDPYPYPYPYLTGSGNVMKFESFEAQI